MFFQYIVVNWEKNTTLIFWSYLISDPYFHFQIYYIIYTTSEFYCTNNPIDCKRPENLTVWVICTQWLMSWCYDGGESKKKYVFPQSVTAMATPIFATLIWLCIWPLEMSVEEYAMTVSTTPWGTNVTCANHSTIKTLQRILETLKYA